MISRASLAAAIVFLALPALPAEPLDLASARQKVEGSISSLKKGQYPEKEHKELQALLSGLTAKVAAEQKSLPEPLRPLPESLGRASAQETAFWSGLSAQQKLGAQAIPGPAAALLLQRLQALAALLPSSSVPDGQALRQRAGPPSKKAVVLESQAAVVSKVGRSGALDPDLAPGFWDRNTRRGDVAATFPVAAASGQKPGFGASPGQLKGLVLQQVPGPRGSAWDALSQARTEPGLRDAVGLAAAGLRPGGLIPPGSKSPLMLSGRVSMDAPDAGGIGSSAGAGRTDFLTADACGRVLADHPSLAARCRQWPMAAPLLAGLLDAFKEQFGTVTGALTTLAFLLVGLLLSAVSGFGLVAKVVVSMISAGLLTWTAYSLIKQAWAAFRLARDSEEGSASRVQAYRLGGKVAGSVLILGLMALIGYGIGKTQTGKAAMSFTQGKLTAGLQRIGVADKVAALDAKVPASVRSWLTGVFGPAKVQASQEPAQPRQGELTGAPARINPAETPGNQAALLRQNEAARILADNGYRVHQNGLSAGADYLIDGVGHDCYSPTTKSPGNIWSTVAGKVAKHQANSFVLNLDGTPVELGLLQQQFARYPIGGLGEILVVRGGRVLPLIKAGQPVPLPAPGPGP